MLRKKYDALLPKQTRIFLLLALIWNFTAYYGGRLLSFLLPHAMFALPIDAQIPFVPWTILIYVVSFPFWVVNYILVARRDMAHVARYFCADFMTRVVSLACFVFLPTTLVQPAVTGTDFWSFAVRTIYFFDRPDNLFPSIHCIASFLCAVGITTDRRIPLWYRCFSWLLAAAICVSTVTTKQHVFVDVIAGLALPALCYALAGWKPLAAWYLRFATGLQRKFSRK